MNIQTKFLGEVEIQETEIISFKEGLPGFPHNKNFILLSLDADLPIALLQSTEQEEISFVVAYPFAFKKDYVFDLSEDDKEQLQIEKEEDVLTYAIVTLKENFQQSTLNLLAPIVINNEKKLGKQIVLLDNELHPLRYLIGTSTPEGSVK